MFKRCLYVGLVLSYFLQFYTSPIPAAAASNSLVIYQLQTGSSLSASQEYVSLYNNSSAVVDVTGWCVIKSSGADGTKSQLACLAPPEANIKLMLPAGGTITLASNEFSAVNPNFMPDLKFTANLATTSGHIRIIDNFKQEIDRLGWGSAVNSETATAPAAANSNILQRKIVADALQDTDNNSTDFTEVALAALPATSLYEEEVPLDICGNLDDFQTTMPEGYLFDDFNNCQKDSCLNLDGLQVDIPDGYVESDATCMLIPLENASLQLTELLPNADSYDTGQEYIEIYNPHDRAVSLKGYVLQLGPNFDKSYALTDQTINPASYLVFSDTVTKLVLPNTSATVRLVAPDGSVASQATTYVSPDENQAWALIGSDWQYTNQPTPGAANVASLDEHVVGGDEEIPSLLPCPAGQYRNASTNRCRLLEIAASTLTSCKQGQERNPETNRCRASVLSAVANLTPCKPDQERNPATNRCRSVASSSLAACGVGQERNPETNRCRKISAALGAKTTAKVQDVATGASGSGIKWWLVGAAIAGAVGYAIYEWRQDVANIIHKRRAKKLTKLIP